MPVTDPDVSQGQGRTGFRTGFGLTILVAAALACIYVFSDQIAAGAPALEPQMDAYRASVDAARHWLDTAALNASVAIQGLSQDE